MTEQINTKEYWNNKWSKKEHAGKWGERGYYFLKDILPKDESFIALDLGCGRGAGIRYLKESFNKGSFSGVDFSDKAIEIAKSIDSDSYYETADIYKYKDGPYDYIFMIAILEHLRWPDKIIKYYLPMTKKAIYISIPINNWECKEHIYAYGTAKNPFEKYGAEIIGNIDGRKKLKIEVK